jgi:outer membrane biosynthesis protein TonB
MKRCPQCDFIYEDDQSLCDMDGRELVYAPTKALPPLEDDATQTARLPAAPPRRRYALLAIAGVILAAGLFSAYYVSTHGAAPQPSVPPAASVAAAPAATPELVPAAPAASPQLAPTPELAAKAKAPKGRAPKAADSAPSAARPTPAPAPSPAPKRQEKKPQEEKEPKSERARPKKESKLGTILKKTGRLLKKPFKF